MNIEEIALRLIESDCNTDYYFKILNELENHTTKIQELEKEKAHIEIAYEEDYKEQQREIERLNKIRQQVIDELFDLKNMIYKPETREINFDVQNKISSIIKILGSDKE